MPKGVYPRKPKTANTETIAPKVENKEDGKPSDYKPTMAHVERSSIMDQIAQRAQADRESEIANQSQAIDTSDEESMRSDNEETEETTEQTPQQVSNETEAVAETKPEVKKKLKGIVDGQEKEFDEEEVIKAGLATLQKQTAADDRLIEAKRILDEARTIASPKKEQPSASPSEVDTGKTGLPEPELQAIAKAMLYGTEEEAANGIKKLAHLIGQGQANQLASQKNLSPQDVMLYANEAFEFNEAKRKFQMSSEQGGYQDIWDDPQLRKMAFDKENELIANGDKRPYWERFKAIGDEVRTWRDSLVKKHAPKTLENREEKKREATVVKGASVKAVVPETTNVPSSREQVLEQMRRSRNQMSLN